MNRVAQVSWWLAVALLAPHILKADGYRATLGTAPDDVPLVVVSGTPWQMGLSLGSLAKAELQAFAPRFLAEAQAAREEAPDSAKLDEAWRTMEPFRSGQFREELRELAERSGSLGGNLMNAVYNRDYCPLNSSMFF